MATTARRRRTLVGGVSLMFAAVLLLGIAGVLFGTERHSYAGDAVPPTNATVREGHTYRLSIHGGVQALAKRGLQSTGLQCEWASPGAASQVLSITAESAGTKATNSIATFTAPIGGPIQVSCTGVGPVFIDDAENASPDVAGFFLVAGMAVFMVGLLMVSSGKFTSRPRASEWTTSEDEEIERLVQLVHVRSNDIEVTAADADDVKP
jgi:hypothetical protein